MYHPLYVCIALCTAAVAAEPAQYPTAVSQSERLASTLSQDQAVALSLAAQPQLQARYDAIHALREDAVAAGQLPDPKLSVGVQALPLDTFNFNSMDMTQAAIGISQMIPGGAKRALNRARVGRETQLAEADLAASSRGIERDVRLAWLDLWQPTQALGWLHRLNAAYEQQIEWGEVAYKAGKLTRDEILQWRALREAVRDRESEQRLALERARAQLRRWLGKDAEAEPSDELPARLTLASDAAARLDRHPELLRAQGALDVARADAALAREAAKPDWNLGLAYGARSGGRSDLISFQVDVDLPIFQSQRQDRRLTARLAGVNQASEEREDRQRALQAELATAMAERDTAMERMQRYEADILPLEAEREDAALADYRSGKGEWSRVLDARREILETRLQWLAQKAASARADVQLRYLIGDNHE